MYEYTIQGIRITADDEGVPVDTEIMSNNLDVLHEIADKHCKLGYSWKEITNGDEHTGMFMGLYGRLEPFTVW